MKYVTNHFTLEMIEEEEFKIETKTLQKSFFQECVKNATSDIGSKIIARMLHKPIQKQPITLKKGDEIYIVTSDFGRKHSCEFKKSKNFRFELYKIN